MKRIILALLVGGMVFGAVFAAAATLVVDGRMLQAGSDEVLTCDDPGGVQIWYNVIWDAPANDYVVDTVSIGGVSEACNGATVKVGLTALNGDLIREASTTKAAIPPAGNPKVDFIPDVLVKDVYDVHVAIY